MAKAVADTIGENQGGFAYDTFKVSGFSHMHDSGTGGVCDLKNIKLGRLLTTAVSITGQFPYICSTCLSKR